MMATAVGIAIFAIFTVGFIGNFLLIIVLLRQKRVWISTMMYILNLAISDLFFVSTMPLWGYVYMNGMEWPFGLFLCKICGTIPTFNMLSSVFFLSAIAIDRWLAVVHSNGAGQKYRSWTSVRKICAFVWTFSAILVVHRIPLMTLLDDNSTSSALNTTEPRLMCVFFIENGESKFLIAGAIELTVALIGFFLPVTVMVFCYIRIIMTVKRKTLETSKRSPLNRVILLGLAVIIAFIICWLPSQTLRLYSALFGWWDLARFNEKLYEKLYPFTLCLAWLNTIMNPVIYSLTLSNMRTSFLDLFGVKDLARRRSSSQLGRLVWRYSLRSNRSISESTTMLTQIQIHVCKDKIHNNKKRISRNLKIHHNAKNKVAGVETLSEQVNHTYVNRYIKHGNSKV